MVMFRSLLVRYISRPKIAVASWVPASVFDGFKIPSPVISSDRDILSPASHIEVGKGFLSSGVPALSFGSIDGLEEDRPGFLESGAGLFTISSPGVKNCPPLRWQIVRFARNVQAVAETRNNVLRSGG